MSWSTNNPQIWRGLNTWRHRHKWTGRQLIEDDLPNDVQIWEMLIYNVGRGMNCQWQYRELNDAIKVKKNDYTNNEMTYFLISLAGMGRELLMKTTILSSLVPFVCKSREREFYEFLFIIVSRARLARLQRRLKLENAIAKRLPYYFHFRLSTIASTISCSVCSLLVYLVRTEAVVNFMLGWDDKTFISPPMY